MSTPRGTGGVQAAFAGLRGPLLAAGLLAGAGLLDLAGAVGSTREVFIVITQEGISRIDVTGWAWLHAGIAAATVLAALFVVTGHRRAVLTGMVAAAIAIAADLVAFPFVPWVETLAIGLNAVALRLLYVYARAG